MQGVALYLACVTDLTLSANDRVGFWVSEQYVGNDVTKMETTYGYVDGAYKLNLNYFGDEINNNM